MPQKIKVGIVGATGYTGVELARLLLNHSHVDLSFLTSQQYSGQNLSQVYPAFEGHDLALEELNVALMAKRVDAVFLCLPHHEAMNTAKSFLDKGVKVLDLSADFRLKEASTYEKWYGPHSQKEILKEAVYGLPELHRAQIKKAKLVACPGCYPTSIILGLAPLLSEKLISSEDIICDSKSGVSGAGRSAKIETLFCEVNESFKPYNIGKHRHTPEIEQELSQLAGQDTKILFSPHLVPMDRGILSTIYAKPTRKLSSKDFTDCFKKFYKNEKFIRILPVGSFPATASVRGTNFCHISVLLDARTGRVVVCSAIDNLTKGASGQAIQALNVMHGFSEDLGLSNTALIP
ncbi:MAG TPA: N-acetyl-gamma-glutamyl-phosphate reductase [Deltaproteobacteria bacterium]|nr:MAG: N-acetyl-gamma-glutamyl-phosphate reductase [Deltaproteobacteria bacterium GWA2_45_12]HBF13222.1 N-acetyl-gamma-glutamyl-phosphate reductase [Deltaproteobacteria bacterium]